MKISSQIVDRIHLLAEEERTFKKIINAQHGTSIPEFFSQLASLVVNPSNINIGILSRMIDTDDTISSSVEFKSLMVISKIGEYHHENKKIKDFVNDFLKKLRRPTWQETMEGMLTGQGFGFSVSEIVWGLDKSLCKVPIRIPTYHPATICFEVDHNGLITEEGIVQFASQFSFGSNPNNIFPSVKYGYKVRNPFETPFDRLMPMRTPFFSNYYIVRIPRSKAVHYIYRAGQAFGSPYGKTPVRTAHLLWQLKNFILKQLGVGAKRKNSPLLWGTAPQGQNKVGVSNADGTTEQLSPAQALIKMLADAEGDDAIVTGPETTGYKISAIMNQIQMDGYTNTINELNTWLFRCFLLPSLVMTDGSAGSRALGDKHFQIVDRIAETEALNFTNTIITDLIEPCVRDNFGEQDDYGKFMGRPQSIEERERLSNIFNGLANAGWMSPANKEDRSHVRSELNLNEDTLKVFDLGSDDEDDTFTGDAKKKDGQPIEVRDDAAQGSEDDGTRESLNGAQITAVVDIVSKIAAGEMPRSSGLEIIINSLGVSREQAERMIGEAGNGFVPENKDDEPKGEESDPPKEE